MYVVAALLLYAVRPGGRAWPLLQCPGAEGATDGAGGGEGCEGCLHSSGGGFGGSEWQRPDLRPAGMPRASDSAGARTQPQSRSYTHQLLTEEHDKTVREA